MLIIPSIIGVALWFYHIYLATQYEPKEGESDFPIMKYFAILDTKWNYPFMLVLALWGTVYVESWKRKQNTFKYVWAGEQRTNLIKKQLI